MGRATALPSSCATTDQCSTRIGVASGWASASVATGAGWDGGFVFEATRQASTSLGKVPGQHSSSFGAATTRRLCCLTQCLCWARAAECARCCHRLRLGQRVHCCQPVQPLCCCPCRMGQSLRAQHRSHCQHRPGQHLHCQGEQVKQADVILLGFPLLYPMDSEVRRNDLEMYEPVTDPTGPAMTWSMFAVGWLELKDPKRAQQLLSKCFSNITEPFKIWVENADGSGAVNFLTGMGGFLQAILYGYTGFRCK
ncbi:UNVERIFIED_CONTAM: hypothetical protein K2H54_063000 [Gekko kuhli]